MILIVIPRSKEKAWSELRCVILSALILFFSEEIEVQEDFEKGTIKCLLGVSDNKCTIGFANAKYYLRPQTILDKNHLDKTKDIVIVKPIID